MIFVPFLILENDVDGDDQLFRIACNWSMDGMVNREL